MEAKTVKELHELARKLGLTGYSKLRKDELIKLVSASKPKPARAATARKKPVQTRKQPPKSASTARAARTKTAAPAPAATVRGVSRIQPDSSSDQQIETAKYQLAPPGQEFQEPAQSTDLGENIDQLPEPGEPLLCLLPQKPGVVHGYWLIPALTRLASRDLHLRLAHVMNEGIEILDELPLPAPRGHWYFHLDAGSDYGAIYLQLGYYRPDGEFITAIDRGIARIPSLYASDITDRRWWISEEQFRRMYQRAGGFRRDRRLGWAASISSR